MFRQFMIVCWALFIIFSALSLAGFVGYVYYGSKANAIFDMEYEKILGDEESRKAAEFWGIDRLASTPESEEAKSRSQAFGGLSFFGLVSAALMLLWNIVWHTGHWVGMGRNIE